MCWKWKQHDTENDTDFNTRKSTCTSPENSHYPVSWVYALEIESGLEKWGQDLELYFYLKEALR